MSRRFLSLVGGTVLSLVGLVGIAGSAGATDYYAPKASYCPPKVCYQTVTVYETRQVPYQVCETRYDECGRCYTVTVTRYRCVQVPVTRRVPVQCNY